MYHHFPTVSTLQYRLIERPLNICVDYIKRKLRLSQTCQIQENKRHQNCPLKVDQAEINDFQLYVGRKSFTSASHGNTAQLW